MDTTKRSVTKLNLSQIRDGFSTFQENMFDDLDIRRTFNSWYKDPTVDKLLQDTSLYILFFKVFLDADRGLSGLVRVFGIIGLLEESHANHIYITVKTELDALPTRKVWICGEFDQGDVLLDIYGNVHGGHDAFIPKGETAAISLRYNSTKDIKTKRREAIARFLNKKSA
ncbi:MAG: hypothetical protein HGA67_00030 [Candidatus Yonathbacteria bacterium]|nr:hypothetical protein [Candidatus Yonathbacteria bacterium]